MPLADTTSIQFTSPIFVALLSPWLLGERTPREVWLTTAIALLGVCIVLRPNLAALGLAALLPVMAALGMRSEEHTSELQSLMRISYAVFCLKKKKTNYRNESNESLINRDINDEQILVK